MNRIKKVLHEKTFFFEVFFLLLLSLTPLLWLLGGWVILGHDSGFRPNVGHHLLAVWNGWYKTVNTGIDWSLYKGFLIIQAPELLFQFLFGSLERAQLFVLPFWFFSMAMGMYIAVRGFFPEKKYWFLRLYTSIFWIFNFYILQAWGIAERAKFSLYAALPLSILLISKAFQRKIPIPIVAVLFGLLYFFCNGGGSPPLFGASVVVWVLTSFFWTLWLVRKEGWKSVVRGFFILVSCVLAFIVFNTYWILVEAELYRGTYTNAVASEGGIEGLLRWEQVISKNASFINLLRLQGIPDWYENPNHPFSKAFLTNPILIFMSFIPIAAIGIGLVMFRKRIKNTEEKFFVTLLFILLFVGLFFSAGSHTPTGLLYILFMKYIPGFAVFRSSFFKFSPVLWFSIIVLSGFFIQQMLMRLQVQRRNIFSFIILGLILIYHYPFFDPSFFHFDPRFSTRLQIPQYVKDTGKFLDRNNDENGRVLLLPELDRGYINEPIDSYMWGFYSLDVLPRLVSNRSIVANDSPFEVVQYLYDKAYAYDWNEFSILADKLNITQILYRGDEKVSIGKPARWITQDILDRQFGKPEYTKGEWAVYSLQKNKRDIVVEQNIIALIGRIQNESLLLTQESSRSSLIRLSWEEASRVSDLQFAIQSECMYCATDEYRNYTQSIVLPQLRFLPGSTLYSLLGERKIPKGNDSLSPEQFIDMYLSRSLFRLSEYKGLVDQNRPFDTSYADYEASLKKIGEYFEDLEGRNSVLYANRINAYLIKQREILSLFPKGIPNVFIDVEKKITEKVWTSDEYAYRYIVEIPYTADFICVMSSPADFIRIDSQQHETKGVYKLSQGLHLLEIVKEQTDTGIPTVFFRNVRQSSSPVTPRPEFSIVLDTPTEKTIRIEKSSSPYILTLPFTYDNRWEAVVSKGKAEVLTHGLSNGYANGWLVKSEGPVELKIYYVLKERFYQGLVVSGIFLILGVTIVFLSYRRLKEQQL